MQVCLLCLTKAGDVNLWMWEPEAQKKSSSKPIPPQCRIRIGLGAQHNDAIKHAAFASDSSVIVVCGETQIVPRFEVVV